MDFVYLGLVTALAGLSVALVYALEKLRTPR